MKQIISFIIFPYLREKKSKKIIFNLSYNNNEINLIERINDDLYYFEEKTKLDIFAKTDTMIKVSKIL